MPNTNINKNIKNIKNVDINLEKLRIIANKWRYAKTPGNNVDLDKLADFTLKTINEEPFMVEICEIFMYSLSIKAAKDPNFDPETYANMLGDNRDNVKKK